MFQVEPVLWLQSLESVNLTWLMSSISSLGYTPVYAGILIVLIFGLRFKESLFVFLALLICGVFTGSLKKGLAFPRPSDVDSRIIEPGHGEPPRLLDGGAAQSFWGLPSSEAMEAAKIQSDWSYGLPSGHVSSATAFFLALAFFFRSRAVFVFSICWIFLMALSRMYLGRHFIADVLGGMGVGVFSVALTAFLVQPLLKDDSKGSNMGALLRWAVFVIPLVILAPFVEIFNRETIGRLLGLLATYAILLHLGFPSDKGSIWKRSARVVLTILVYLLIDGLMDSLVDAMGLEDNSVGMLFIVFLITCIPFVCTVLIARRLKLYESTEVL